MKVQTSPTLDNTQHCFARHHADNWEDCWSICKDDLGQHFVIPEDTLEFKFVAFTWSGRWRKRPRVAITRDNPSHVLVNGVYRCLLDAAKRLANKLLDKHPTIYVECHVKTARSCNPKKPCGIFTPARLVG